MLMVTNVVCDLHLKKKTDDDMNPIRKKKMNDLTKVFVGKGVEMCSCISAFCGGFYTIGSIERR